MSRYRRWGRKTARLGRRPSRADQSAARSAEYHDQKIAGARTAEQLLAASFDKFRAGAVRNPGDVLPMTEALMQHAHAVHGVMGRPALEQRHLGNIGAAKRPTDKLRAAYDGYRAAVAAARREYDGDAEMLASIRGDVLHVCAALSGDSALLAA